MRKKSILMMFILLLIVIAGCSQKSTNDTNNLTEVCLDQEKLCVNIPNDWKYVKDIQPGDEYGEGEYEFTFSNTKGNTVIKLVSLEGLGGACPTQTPLYIIKNQPTNITGNKEAMGENFYDDYETDVTYAAAVIGVSEDGKEYAPEILWHNDKNYIGTDETKGCEGKIQLLSDFIGAHNIKASISLRTNGLGVYNTMEEAEKVLNTEENKEAFDIIASAHYKE